MSWSVRCEAALLDYDFSSDFVEEENNPKIFFTIHYPFTTTLQCGFVFK